MAMGKACRTPSLVALALLVALLAAAMEHYLAAAAEEGSAAPVAADADAPAAADGSAAPVAVDADAPAAADEDTTGGDGAPTPAPAIEEEEATSHKTLGAKARAGLHTMMESISEGKAKLECKVLGNCPASEAPSAQ